MGRVLKNLGRIVPAEVLDARAQASALLEAAGARAAGVAAQAAAEAAALREEARRQGLEEGRAAAEALLTEKLAMLVAEAERARGEAQPLALKLAAKMAEKIVGRAVELAPAALAEILGQALQASRARAGVVKLRVHPEDLAILERDPARGRLVSRIGAGAELRLVADAAVGRCGCVVETSAGRLDARLETQLGALEKALRGTNGRESSHG